MTKEIKINRCGCGGKSWPSSAFDVGAHIVYCEKCGLRTEDCDSLEEAIESWNTAFPRQTKCKFEEQSIKNIDNCILKSLHAHEGKPFPYVTEIRKTIKQLETVKLSNAMQTIQWLEDGKKICSDEVNDSLYIQKRGDRVSAYKKGTNFMQCSMDIEWVFQYAWKIYEEPKYKEITGEEALTDFALNGKNKDIVILYQGNEYFIVSIIGNQINFERKDGETMNDIELITKVNEAFIEDVKLLKKSIYNFHKGLENRTTPTIESKVFLQKLKSAQLLLEEVENTLK